MANYKAYPEYKDSGVEWLNSTPAHWSSAPIKYLALATNSLFLDGDWIESKDISDDGVRYITTGNVGEGLYKEQGSGFISENTFSKLNCTEVFKGDILISRLNNPIGRACLVPDLGYKTVTSVDNVIFRTDEYYNRSYLVYLFSSKDYFQHTGNLARGTTMQRISRGLLGNIRIPVPTLSEQVVIAAFLDHEIAKIDNLIEKQQQLIELLKEKRQAVISHTVTKGLNPDVPMKDSGVEWLGEVPKHWKCGYLRWYISVSSGTYLNNKEFETDESNDCMNPVIGGNGVMGFTSKTNDGNCLVVGRVGALCGNVHQIRRSCWVTDNALKITYGCDFDVDYLEMYLKVLDLNKLANHNAQPLITGTMIKEQVAIIPPIDEQKNITKFIQSKVGKIDLLILKSSEAVDKIKERRTALISAAVTGKIDVRDWVAPDTQDIEASQEATA